MSVPAPFNASPQPSGQVGTAADPGAKKFGAPPVGAMLTAVIAVVGGAAGYVVTTTRTVTASCGGSPMSPGDTCTTTRRGIETGTQTYWEVLAQAERINTAGRYIGLALVVIGVVFGVLAFVRWRQDVAVRAQLRDEHGPPLSSHSKTATSSLLMLVFGAAFSAGAVYCVLTGLESGSWGWYVGAVVAGVIGLGMLWAAVPENGALVQTFEQGVRFVAGGKVRDVRWADIQYVIVPGKGQATHSIKADGVPSLTTAALSNGTVLQEIAQDRSVRAKVPAALEQIDRGGVVDFGYFSVSREGIGASGKTLPWQEYAGIALHQGQVTVSKSPRGTFASVSLGQVRDYVALINVIDAVGRRVPRTPM